MKTRLESLPPNIRAKAEEALRGPALGRAVTSLRYEGPPIKDTHRPAPKTSRCERVAPCAKPRGTVCHADGIRFPSKTQLRVYLRLKAEIQPPLTLFIEPRFPVFTFAPNERLRPLYVTPDFAVWDGTKIVRIVDAKPKNRKAHSRDWHRGKRALEACIGIRVEEVDR